MELLNTVLTYIHHTTVVILCLYLVYKIKAASDCFFMLGVSKTLADKNKIKKDDIEKLKVYFKNMILFRILPVWALIIIFTV